MGRMVNDVWMNDSKARASLCHVPMLPLQGCVVGLKDFSADHMGASGVDHPIKCAGVGVGPPPSGLYLRLEYRSYLHPRMTQKVPAYT